MEYRMYAVKRRPDSARRSPSPVRAGASLQASAPRQAPAVQTAQNPAGDVAASRSLAAWAHGPAQAAAPRSLYAFESAHASTARDRSSDSREAEKKRITEIALTAADAEYGLRLGGSRALVLHGLTERTTDDIDLFAPSGQNGYRQAVIDALKTAGYAVEATMSDSGAALVVSSPSGVTVDVEMASSLPLQDAPVDMDGVPVMSMADCVRLKYGAMCSARPREKDLIDVYGIFEKLGADCLPGLGVNLLLMPGFFRALKRAGDVGDDVFAAYGVACDRADLMRRYLVEQSGRADQIEEEILAQFQGAGAGAGTAGARKPWWACLIPCATSHEG